MKPTITIILFFFSVLLMAQNPKRQKVIDNALANESIKNQFELLLSNSADYQNFKNIKHSNLTKFKRNFSDSLIAFDKKFDAAYSKIKKQQNEISTLKNEIESINNNLTNVTAEKDSVGLFGTRVTKTFYNLLLWSLILGLLATTLLFLFRFKSSNSTTKLTKKSFIEVEDEFEDHKRKSLEREQVLRRRLQDEINKQRGV